MERVGTLLWEMRATRGWSLGELTRRRASVSKAAISRWEAGARQLRVSELDAAPLGAGASQRALALSSIREPRGLRRLRSADASAGLGAPPTAGDPLHAMRHRREYTQEQVAALVGVGQTAVARWARGERLPSNERMQTLCFALGARDEELIALTTGGFAESPDPEPRGWEKARLRLLERLEWRHYIRPEEDGGASELEYLVLERKARILATREERARPALAEILDFHADAMRNRARWTEAGALADRAPALIPRREPEPSHAFRAGAVAAAVAVHGGSAIAPERGLRLLRPWLERSPSPEYRAWIMSDIAEYPAMGRYVDEARSPAEHACRVARYCGLPVELDMRRVDQERVLPKAGRPEEALRVTLQIPPTTVAVWPKSYPYVRRALTLAEANEQVGDLDTTSEWLRRARAVIDRFGHERLRARAEALASRL